MFSFRLRQPDEIVAHMLCVMHAHSECCSLALRSPTAHIPSTRSQTAVHNISYFRNSTAHLHRLSASKKNSHRLAQSGREIQSSRERRERTRVGQSVVCVFFVVAVCACAISHIYSYSRRAHNTYTHTESSRYAYDIRHSSLGAAAVYSFPLKRTHAPTRPTSCPCCLATLPTKPYQTSSATDSPPSSRMKMHLLVTVFACALLAATHVHGEYSACVVFFVCNASEIFCCVVVKFPSAV